MISKYVFLLFYSYEYLLGSFIAISFWCGIAVTQYFLIFGFIVLASKEKMGIAKMDAMTKKSR